jgi:L-threonylcarbamoyladenylate synthase
MLFMPHRSNCVRIWQDATDCSQFNCLRSKLPALVLHAACAYVEPALQLLRAGGLVAFPTDTVYGVGALAFDTDAVKRLYWAKKRSANKAIPILLGSVSGLPQVAENAPAMALTLANRFWPGPLTLVVRKAPNVPTSVTRGATVGVRVPDHVVALTLLQAAGPLAVSSANVSGQAPAQTAAEVVQQLESKVDLVIDGDAAPGGVASTVVDCTGAAPRILRHGPITSDDIYSALGGATAVGPTLV